MATEPARGPDARVNLSWREGLASARALPASIWAMGLGSFFMDMSSELVHSVLPVFMTTVLGASMMTVGLLEGMAEATAAVTKAASGALSDRVARRKGLVVFGYALAALTKPIFPLATSVSWVFGARVVDRIGKGIRGAPRDALIADLVPAGMRGAAYGLRQALDSAGAFVGPMLAVAFLWLFANDVTRVMWIGVVPACIAVAVLTVYVHEPEHPAGAAVGVPLSVRHAGQLPRRYWLVVLLGAVFTLARFSEAFLVLRAQSVGVPLGLVPVVMVVMNVCYAACAYPAGVAADRVSRRSLLTGGLMVLVVADLMLAVAQSPWVVLVGGALWGLHMAITQGVLSKLVADAAPANQRGTAFGIFNFVTGGALLLASAVAGALWSVAGPAATFAAGATFAAVSALGLRMVGDAAPSLHN